MSATTTPRDAAARLGPTLERVRKRLLDLSANNALLNSSSLRIVDEVPAQVFERLVDGAKFTFAPLPEPDRAARTAQLALPTPEPVAPAAETPEPAAAADPRTRARLERKAAQSRRDAARLRAAQALGIATSLDVFCSFDPNALRVNAATSPRGLRVLRDYLRYAAGDPLWWAAGAESGRAPDSDFEVAVATALRQRGHEVRAQVGVAGYFLDLAVVDPDAPGRFLLGVECDGATYHSAKTARDRDRLRQRQLESLGWTLHRIWSTDWFRDPAGQTERLCARIEELRCLRNAGTIHGRVPG